MPKTNTKQRILDYVAQFGEASPHQLVTYLGISPQALFRHLKALMESNQHIGKIILTWGAHEA